jgi:hypothetical protein
MQPLSQAAVAALVAQQTHHQLQVITGKALFLLKFSLQALLPDQLFQLPLEPEVMAATQDLTLRRDSLVEHPLSEVLLLSQEVAVVIHLITLK